MTMEMIDDKAVIEAVQAIVARYGATREELIPILNEINRNIGYIPSSALKELSRLLRVPQSQLFSVTTFYSMLSTKPRGQHIIQFCESAPCHVAGGRLVWQALQDELNLQPGCSSADGKWTLLTTSCLGLCGVGPVLVIDNDIYGNVTSDQIPEILAKYG